MVPEPPLLTRPVRLVQAASAAMLLLNCAYCAKMRSAAGVFPDRKDVRTPRDRTRYSAPSLPVAGRIRSTRTHAYPPETATYSESGPVHVGGVKPVSDPVGFAMNLS